MSRYETALAGRATSGAAVEGIDHDLVRRVATWERKDATTTTTGENVFSMMRRIGQAKAGLAADYAAQLARSAARWSSSPSTSTSWTSPRRPSPSSGIRFSSIRGDQTPTARQKNIDAFVNDPDVAIAVCSLTAAGVGINLQVASNIVLAELSWTDAEQTQAIDRSHRIGQTEPVTAWRIIAAQTIDARIAELIDSKAGLAARALDGSDEEVVVVGRRAARGAGRAADRRADGAAGELRRPDHVLPGAGSASAARHAGAWKVSAKYCVSCTTCSWANSMMLTEYVGTPS